MIVISTRSGVPRPLHNHERIAAYRQRVDETSEFHRDRHIAGSIHRARFLARLPAVRPDTARPAFTPQAQPQRRGEACPPSRDADHSPSAGPVCGSRHQQGE